METKMFRKAAGACLVVLLLTAIGPLSVSQAAKFTAEPLELGFRNNAFVGDAPETKEVTFTNVSGETLTPTEALFEQTEVNTFTVVEVTKCTGRTIHNGETCVIKVTYTPQVEQKEFGGKYEIQSKAAGGSWGVVKYKGGTKHPNAKAELVSEADSKDLTLLTKMLGLKLTVTCTNLEFVGLRLESEGKLNTEGKARLKGCEAYGKGTLEEPLGCHVKSTGAAAGTIESKEVKGALVLHEIKAGEKEILTKIEPKTGTTLATVLTSECAMPESNPVNGVLFVKDGEKLATAHNVKHLIEQGPLTSLYVGSDTAEHLETSIDGSVWGKLGGTLKGITWGAYYAGSTSTWVVLNGE
jgi:hypothetical protein